MYKLHIKSVLNRLDKISRCIQVTDNVLTFLVTSFSKDAVLTHYIVQQGTKYCSEHEVRIMHDKSHCNTHNENTPEAPFINMEQL